MPKKRERQRDAHEASARLLRGGAGRARSLDVVATAVASIVVDDDLRRWRSVGNGGVARESTRWGRNRAGGASRSRSRGGCGAVGVGELAEAALDVAGIAARTRGDLVGDANAVRGRGDDGSVLRNRLEGGGHARKKLQKGQQRLEPATNAIRTSISRVVKAAS